MEDKGSTTERAEIIAYLKAKDNFFEKVDFSNHTLAELKNFKRRWDNEVLPAAGKNSRTK